MNKKITSSQNIELTEEQFNDFMQESAFLDKRKNELLKIKKKFQIVSNKIKCGELTPFETIQLPIDLLYPIELNMRNKIILSMESYETKKARENKTDINLIEDHFLTESEFMKKYLPRIQKDMKQEKNITTLSENDNLVVYHKLEEKFLTSRKNLKKFIEEKIHTITKEQFENFVEKEKLILTLDDSFKRILNIRNYSEEKEKNTPKNI